MWPYEGRAIIVVMTTSPLPQQNYNHGRNGGQGAGQCGLVGGSLGSGTLALYRSLSTPPAHTVARGGCAANALCVRLDNARQCESPGPRRLPTPCPTRPVNAYGCIYYRGPSTQRCGPLRRCLDAHAREPCTYTTGARQLSRRGPRRLVLECTSSGTTCA